MQHFTPTRELSIFVMTGNCFEQWLLRNGPPFIVGLLSRLLLYAALLAGSEMPLGLQIEHSRFFKYDALWHWEILENGYEASRHGNTLVTHYSPVWPFVMGVFSVLLGEDRLRMMMLNCVFFGLTAVALAKMARAAGLTWWKPVVFFCSFPTAFFANSVYNEPLFMLATVMSMSMLLENRPMASGVWAALGVSVRVNGWAQVAAWIHDTASRGASKRHWILPSLFIVAASLIQPACIWYWRGSPVAHYEDLEKVEWMASPQLIPFKEPLETLVMGVSNPSLLEPSGDFMFQRGWSAIVLLICLVVLILSWRTLPSPVKVQGLFTILGLSLLEQAISLPRYAMAFMPFYFLAARLHPWILGVICSMMAWSQLYLVIKFIRGGWAF